VYEKQIAAGIAHLEAEGIDWRAQLRDKPLNMAIGAITPFYGACVLAHLRGEYHLYLNEHGKSNRWAADHGFFVHPDDLPAAETFFGLLARAASINERYDILTREWLAVINADVPDHVPASLPVLAGI